jgi:hypothetical protein
MTSNLSGRKRILILDPVRGTLVWKQHREAEWGQGELCYLVRPKR